MIYLVKDGITKKATIDDLYKKENDESMVVTRFLTKEEKKYMIF